MASLIAKVGAIAPLEPGERILDEIRVESRTRRSLGLAAVYQFEIIGIDGSGMAFELENRKDARAFNDALGRRLVARR